MFFILFFLDKCCRITLPIDDLSEIKEKIQNNSTGSQKVDAYLSNKRQSSIRPPSCSDQGKHFSTLRY